MDRQSILVKKMLEDFGFQVDIIPEDKVKRQADLRAHKDGITTYVEVKSRLEDEKVNKVIESAVPGGPVVTYLGEAGKRNKFSSIVKDANEQLNITATPNDYRVLWFVVTAVPECAAATEQMLGTILGTRQIFCKREKESLCRPCYYAGYADFERYRDIDGVVIQNGEGGVLVVNEFSPRVEGFGKSPLYQHFKQRNAILEVSQEEKKGKAFTIREKIDRDEKEAILRCLRSKYPAWEFQAVTDFKTVGVFASIPNPEGNAPKG
jgi:hypothetical protein